MIHVVKVKTPDKWSQNENVVFFCELLCYLDQF